MKKWIIFAIAIILLIALTLTLFVTWLRMAFKVAFRLFANIDFYSRKISQPQNVYEEIWNLLLTEEYSQEKTVLTTSTEGAKEDWELFSQFVGVYIPESNVSLHWDTFDGETELKIYVSTHSSNPYKATLTFSYNRTTNTLYGDTEELFLLENFLEDYFEWCEDSEEYSSDYSMDSLGDVTFQYVEEIWNRGQYDE